MEIKDTSDKSKEERKRKQKKYQKFFTVGIIIFIALSILGKFILPFIWGPIGVNIVYSEGERSGMVIKLAERGLIWKTFEGEAVLSQKGFAVTYVWAFSVDDKEPNKEELINKLQTAFENGNVIKIKYVQMAGYVPWRSKTTYLIKEIEFIE